MLTEDVVVYADPDGRHYVALVGEQWLRWPAEANGWRERQGCPASYAEQCRELEYPHDMLALRLSGVD
jgi:hypothetical protein